MSVWTIFMWMCVGTLSGLIATILVPRGLGLLAAMFIGLCGAFIGGYIGAYFGVGAVTGFNLISILLSVAGAVVLLVVLKLLGV